jgi:DNA-binding beta-propeller fold protein YncE
MSEIGQYKKIRTSVISIGDAPQDSTINSSNENLYVRNKDDDGDDIVSVIDTNRYLP